MARGKVSAWKVRDNILKTANRLLFSFSFSFLSRQWFFDKFLKFFRLLPGNIGANSGVALDRILIVELWSITDI